MRKFLFLLSFLASLVGVGQQANVTLDVKPSDGQRTVRQDQTTIDAAKAVYPNWYARAKVLGWTDAQFLDQSKFVAKWQQLQYYSSPLGVNAPTASTVNVTSPEGAYYVNAVCELGNGTYRGSGTFVYHPGNYTTVLHVWHEKWIGTGPRDIFHTANYGTDNWQESFRIEGFRLEGRAATAVLPDPTYISTGLVVGDAGETSCVNYIFASNFNTAGVEFDRGTPVSCQVLSVFSNCVAGVILTGSALNTFNFGTLSADDNDAVILQRPGRGRQAGGAVFVSLIKSEGGVSDRVQRAQKMAVLAGQTGLVVGVAKGSLNSARVENLIEIDCRLTDGTKQVSNIVIGSISGFGYNNVIKDVANGWTAKSPGDHKCYEFHYTSEFGGKVFNPFFTFERSDGGGVTNPPVDPPVNPPTTVLKYTETRTTATTATTRKTAPATLGTVTSVKLVNLKLSAVTIMTWINSALFVGQDGVLWVAANGGMVSTGIKPTAGQAINATVNIGSALTHTIGSPNGSTALWSGTIEHY